MKHLFHTRLVFFVFSLPRTSPSAFPDGSLFSGWLRKKGNRNRQQYFDRRMHQGVHVCSNSSTSSSAKVQAKEHAQCVLRRASAMQPAADTEPSKAKSAHWYGGNRACALSWGIAHESAHCPLAAEPGCCFKSKQTIRGCDTAVYVLGQASYICSSSMAPSRWRHRVLPGHAQRCLQRVAVD